MRTVILAGLCLMTLPPSAMAQGADWKSSFGVRVGALNYQFQGSSGTGELVGLVFSQPVHQVLVLEGALPVLDDEQTIGFAGGAATKRVSALLPEVSLEAQLPLGRVRPYVGGGGGGVVKLDGPGTSGFTAHVAGGVRVVVARRFNIQADVRRRWSSKWARWTMDYTLGLNWTK